MEAIRQNSVLSYDPNLHTSRNPHAFVSRLPTEILQDIFIHCAQDYHYQYFKLSPKKPVPSWVNVSYVCRHWRNVALGTPTLWTYLFIISQRWTEVLLARSEQASLKINFDYVPRGILWSLLSCVERVMNHVERIQELTLHIPVSFAHRVLSKLSSHAPRLQNLDIMVEDPSVEWPSLLFDGDPPALHSLRLVGCRVPLHLFRLDALTVLHLVNVPVRFQQNMEEFLAALSHMQDLKYLHLCHALPSATGFLSSAVFKTFRKIDLTYLSRLWIHAPLSTVVTLLSCVNIPLKTQVRLECDSEPNPSLGHYALLPSLLAQRYKDRAQSSPTIRSLVIRFTEGSVLLAFNPRQRDTTHGPWDDTHLSIELDLPMVDRDVIVNDICSFMPLSNVQTLSVIRPWFSLAFWRRILRQLQDVRYITLSGGNMPDFSVLSLTDRTTRDSEGEDAQNHSGLAFSDRSQSHILAPRLEELELKCITFLPGDGYNLPAPSAITRSCLCDALSTRRGSPGRLTITRGYIPGSARFDMAAVWGDDGFHVVSERVHPPELDWEYGYNNNNESVHSPEVDSDSDLEEEEESVHSPEVDSDLDLEEEEEGSVYSPEVDSEEEEEESVHSPEVDSDLDLEEEEESVHSPEVDLEDLEEEVEEVGEGEECVYYPEVDSEDERAEEEEEEECMYSSSSSPEVDSEDEECVHSFEGDASDWGDDMDDSGYSDDG